MEHIKKVYVVHKTHLDIGFTDYAQNVLDHYVNNFIPKAIETAYEVNASDSPKQFVWTVGSYLIKYYMEHSDMAAKQKLETAIRDGYVEWHLLPFSTHTELMNADLFNYGIQIGKELDKIYGKNHIAAKLTDVPGITHAAIPYLEQKGIKYLHIGINAASKAVQVPELCVFKYGMSEVILNYAKDYGESVIYKDIALEFAHTADNMGPPDALCVRQEMERLRLKYPKATIVSCGLDDFAREIMLYKDELPVISCEMGDTWIHGIASDPFKTAMFCELKRIRQSWMKEYPTADSTREYDKFMENMLLLCEHTWGLDSKKYLYDYLNWDKNDFLHAKAFDITDDKNLKAGGPIIETFIKNEWNNTQMQNFPGSYSKMESSWKEQRNYLEEAAKQLPEDLYHEFLEKKKYLRPCSNNFAFDKADGCVNLLGMPLKVSGWKVAVATDGSLQIYEKKDRRFHNTSLGVLQYETYDDSTVSDYYRNYNRNFEAEGAWAEPDFSKPGLYRAKTAQNNTYDFQVGHLELRNETITVYLLGSVHACEAFGCPRKVKIIYMLHEDYIKITISWFDKSCCKIPEAVYLKFMFDSYDNMTLSKLGRQINPSRIITGGNSKLHAVEEVAASTWKIVPVHSPLLSIGGRSLYDCSDTIPDCSDGIYFILHNNRWNTNFPLWYGENAAFDFMVRI